MGRRSRTSAKTGDQSIYKNRSRHQDAGADGSDDDGMYNEVERYHNRKEEENYLHLDAQSDAESSSDEDDGVTKKREGVFDLGLRGSDEDESESGEDEGDDEDLEARREKQRRAEEYEAALASSSEEGDSDLEEELDKKSNLLNWGDKKSYYHGDTADLEIGQDVEDAYLEEEAGREVEQARLEGMEDEDFMLDSDDESVKQEVTVANSKSSSSKKRADEIEAIKSSKSSKQMSKLSRKEKIKLIKANHPELLPIVQHFRDPVQELQVTTVATGALLKNGVTRGVEEANAVGCTTAGLQYLLAKTMLQASQALNLSLYLLLKADQASKAKHLEGTGFSLEDDTAEDALNHPVMERLNELSLLTDKLREGVEEKTPGLREQLRSLVKAASLMNGGDVSTSGDSSEDSDSEGGEEIHSAVEDFIEKPQPSVQPSSDASSSSPEGSDDDEDSNQVAVQRRIMNEARFSVRNQDINQDNKTASKKRKRRAAPLGSEEDYGDDATEENDRAVAAGKNLASTLNSIAQKEATSKKRRGAATGDEAEAAGEDYEQLQRGLSLMEDELGAVSDEDDDGDDDDEGLVVSDDDDFYQKIKAKSKAKKEAKRAMYEVAPKYPRLDGEVDGERAIGRTIMKNRGLVAHKPKMNRNPRVKKREQYRKALIRRKGAVREIRTDEGHAYGGESTGIKSGISRSRKLA